MGILIGAIVGGGAGGYVARSTTQVPVNILDTPTTLPPPPAVSAAPISIANDQIVGVVKELLPSVVTVVNKLPNDTPQSSGSGFVIDAARGFIATNNHVIENVNDGNASTNFDVIFSDDRTVKAKLVGRDPLTDIAVLQVPSQGLKAATLANSDDVPVGATVVAIGSALGTFQSTVTTGVVSAKGRRVPESPTVFLEDLIQTDAAINSGNSGGPLIWAATKQVVGMNTLVTRANNAEGLGFSISSNTIRTIANELIANGRVERGVVGIQYQEVTPRAAVSLGLPPQTSGIIITQVISGSPAAQAGLRPRDVVTKINDQQIDIQHPLQTVMAKFKPGQKVALTVIRDGKQQIVDVTLGR
ncbi:MAG: trypsin-like peptidase domain-containing protein [Chloroflexi bacterium]|nr:trypsin-like peptidase domain-containing protein [Chloroflexota bacterium]